MHLSCFRARICSVFRWSILFELLTGPVCLALPAWPCASEHALLTMNIYIYIYVPSANQKIVILCMIMLMLWRHLRCPVSWSSSASLQSKLRILIKRQVVCISGRILCLDWALHGACAPQIEHMISRILPLSVLLPFEHCWTPFSGRVLKLHARVRQRVFSTCGGLTSGGAAKPSKAVLKKEETNMLDATDPSFNC